MNDHLPNIQPELIDLPSLERLEPKDPSTHKPRILLLYGSTRERSFSRLMVRKLRACWKSSAPKPVSSTLPACRSRMTLRTPTRRCWNSAS